MTIIQKKKVTCAHCGHRYETGLFCRIDTEDRPDLKSMARSLSRYLPRCPSCETHSLKSEHLFVYHQQEDDFLLIYAPMDPEDAMQACLAEGLVSEEEFKPQPGRTVRIVRSTIAFREKLKLLDDGLDDHIIETMKVILGMGLFLPSEELLPARFTYEFSLPGRELVFHRLSTKCEPNMPLPMDRFNYDILLETYGREMQADPAMVVDGAWASAFFKKYSEPVMPMPHL